MVFFVPLYIRWYTLVWCMQRMVETGFDSSKQVGYVMYYNVVDTTHPDVQYSSSEITMVFDRKSLLRS